MSQPLCSPEKDTNEEEDIIPTGIPTNIEYTNYDVSSSTTPESRGGDGTILSLLSSPETELRDYDIICSNGITDHDQDNHRGNIQMKEIIKGFVRKWNITNPEQRNQTCEDNLLEEIKHKIEEQDGRPSFLIRNADDTQWGIASDQFIHDEILREWRHYKDTYQPVVNDQKTNDDNHHGQEEENNDRDIEEQAISSISPHAKDVSALYKYRIQFSHEPNTSGTTRQHDPAEETNLQPLGHLHNYDAPHRSTTQAYSEVGELPKATSGFPDSSVPDIAMWEQEKEGGKCCGCCCDYRRAVIILCIIRLIYEGGAGGAMFMTPFGLEVQLSVLIGIAGSIAALIGALKFIPRLVALKVVEILGMYSLGCLYS